MIDISNISLDELNSLLDNSFKDIEEENYKTLEKAF